jgi:hypothetical protein
VAKAKAIRTRPSGMQALISAAPHKPPFAVQIIATVITPAVGISRHFAALEINVDDLTP